MKPYRKAEAEVYVLSQAEGGRHTPFFTGYKPQFYIRTSDITGEIALPDGVEMVMPGDNITMTVSLITPIAVEEGLRFAIREGGRTVGAGVFTKLLEVTSWPASPPTPGRLSPSSALTAGSATTRPSKTGAATPAAWNCGSTVAAAATIACTAK